jgi:hypothetical protein
MIQALIDNQDVFSAEIRAQTSTISGLFQEARNQQIKTRDAIMREIRQLARAKSRNGQRQGESFDIPSWEYQQPVNDQNEEDESDVGISDDEDTKDRKKVNSHRKNQEQERMKAEAEFKHAILQSLRFPTMQNRRLDILEAHATTFEWIYRDPMLEGTLWSNFSEWLRQGSGIYWVNGKAGSGKSTLMRFIYEDERTVDLLGNWGGSPDKVTMAGFFFWNSGAPEQSSQSGLLRSLLHEILSLKPEFIPSVFPERWQDFEAMEGLDDRQSVDFKAFIYAEEKYQRTLSQHMQAFQRLLKQDLGYVCLFIDGLDEYQGDPMDTITIFKLVVSAKLKICLSSRPWLPFEDELISCPKLKLQDLTRPDIQIYVNDNLSDNPRMKRMQELEPLEAPKLVQEIVDKAHGVFLWIKLVVASLLRGLTNRDQIFDLQRRIRALPEQLELLFTYMIQQIEPIYQDEGSRIFRIMLTSQAVSAMLDEEEDYVQVEGLCAIDLSFALEDTKTVLETPIKLLKDEEVFRRSEEVECKLKVRCAGLLEIPTPCLEDTLPGRKMSKRIGNTKVHWLHRTVKDFLEVEENQKLLLKIAANTVFSPSLPLLRASILRLKTWLLNTPAENGVHPLPGLVARALIFAHQTEYDLNQAQVELLDDLDNTVNQLFPLSGSHWADEILNVSFRKSGEWNDNFITLAVQYDLPLYLSQKLVTATEDLRNKPGRPYLDYIVWSGQLSARTTKPITARNLAMKRDVLAILLRHGCSPNQAFDGKTPWQKAQYKACNHFVELGPIWIEVIDLFLRNGADVMTFEADGNKYEIQKIIERAFWRDFPVESQRLLELLPPPMENFSPVARRYSSRRASSWFKKRFSFDRVTL